MQKHSTNNGNAVNTTLILTKQPHITKRTYKHTHSLQNKLQQPQYKSKQTVQDIPKWNSHNTIEYKVTVMNMAILSPRSSPKSTSIQNKITSHKSLPFTPPHCTSHQIAAGICYSKVSVLTATVARRTFVAVYFRCCETNKPAHPPLISSGLTSPEDIKILLLP